MRELWGPITTEEQTQRCRRMTVLSNFILNINISLLSFKLPSACFCFPVFQRPHILAAFRLVPQSCTSVHSIVTRQNSAHAMRPCRQHLLLNKLLTIDRGALFHRPLDEPGDKSSIFGVITQFFAPFHHNKSYMRQPRRRRQIAQNRESVPFVNFIHRSLIDCKSIGIQRQKPYLCKWNKARTASETVS